MPERRSLETDIELREIEGQPPTITGYAAVYYDGTEGTQYRLAEDIVERIAPGAFDRVLGGPHDVAALFNHDPSHILGRSTAGTLRMESDARGLRYEITAPDTTTAKDVIANLRAGNVKGSSFAFSPKEQKWSRENKVRVRSIVDADLYDVGPVTFPAYSGTTAAVRSEDATDAIEALQQWEQQEALKEQHERNARRIRELRLSLQK